MRLDVGKELDHAYKNCVKELRIMHRLLHRVLHLAVYSFWGFWGYR